jgi:hypothetical protein
MLPNGESGMSVKLSVKMETTPSTPPHLCMNVPLLSLKQQRPGPQSCPRPRLPPAPPLHERAPAQLASNPTFENNFFCFDVNCFENIYLFKSHFVWNAHKFHTQMPIFVCFQSIKAELIFVDSENVYLLHVHNLL